MNSISRRDGLCLLVFAALMGLISGVLVIALFAYFDATNNWQRISNPLDKTVELLDYDDSTSQAYIKTASGNIYACSSSYHSNGKGCEKVEHLPQYPPLNSCSEKIYPTPKPPGTTISNLEVHPCMEDSWVQVNLIVLNDDSIWKWEKIESEVTFFGEIFFTGIGAICGASLGLLSVA
jgi:hypothetical protein